MSLHRALLHLYPKSFRGEYAAEMATVFARQRRDARGVLGVLALWTRAGAEVLFNAVAVLWDIFRQDLRHAVRALRRAPGFAFTAVAVVALGTGANTAVFSVTDYALIRPLPFPESGRLVKLWEPRPGYTRMELSPANYRDWKRPSTGFEAIGAFNPTAGNLAGRGEPQRVDGARPRASIR